MSKRPRIGVTCEFEEYHPGAGLDRSYSKVYHHYYHAIHRAGGVPLLVPVFEQPAVILEAIEGLDGILLTGSDDPPASFFGEKDDPSIRQMPPWRCEQDFLLCRHLLGDSRIPVLGVCGGMQMLALADDGALSQDLTNYSQVDHRRQCHRVSLNQESRLFRIQQAGVLEVNSKHHQALRPGHWKRLRVVAVSEDGVVEAIETRDMERFLIGVQWHPELMLETDSSRKLFSAFVCASAQK